MCARERENDEIDLEEERERKNERKPNFFSVQSLHVL